MPNAGYLDESVHWKIRSGQVSFAEPTHDEVAAAILETGLATSVGQRLGSGKEADVYLCQDGRRPLVVKVYRQYRTSHRGGGPIKLETMGQRALRELDLLSYAWMRGVRVPEPGRRVENMFSMQYLGDADSVAPMLAHVALEDPEPFLEATLKGVEDLAGAGIVHSDLSPFNILVYRSQPWIIDLAAGIRVDRLGAPPWERLLEALHALEKGLGSLQRYFRRYGLEFEPRELMKTVRERIDKFGVL